MSDFQNYMYAQAVKEGAYQQYNYASQLLENKQIMCRFAEIKSQHEPLASIIGNTTATREQLVAACHFVITGRLPDVAPEIKEESQAAMRGITETSNQAYPHSGQCGTRCSQCLHT